MNKQVMVSIICCTYNHEAFIKRALDGFVNQKTDFVFEAIIHDDASTDNTVMIIKEYAEKYPDIIKPIYEEVNQFNNGDYIKNIICDNVRGKYFALCEGDDYWIDDYKLQTQIDFLEKHKSFSASFHDAIIVGGNGKLVRDGFFPGKFFKTPKWENRNKAYDLKDMIEFDFIPTASLVGKMEIYKNFKNFCENPVCSDIPLKMYLALNGDMYYFNRKMSAYRTFNSHSLSGKARNNIETLRNTFLGHISIFKGFDIFTKQKFHDELKNDIKRRRIWYLMSKGDYKKLLKKDNRKIMRERIVFSARVKFWLRLILKPLYDVLYKIREERYSA